MRLLGRGRWLGTYKPQPRNPTAFDSHIFWGGERPSWRERITGSLPPKHAHQQFTHKGEVFRRYDSRARASAGMVALKKSARGRSVQDRVMDEVAAKVKAANNNVDVAARSLAEAQRTAARQATEAGEKALRANAERTRKEALVAKEAAEKAARVAAEEAIKQARENLERAQVAARVAAEEAAKAAHVALEAALAAAAAPFRLF